MAYVDFQTIVQDLENAGIFDVVLPFLLVFTLVFGFLEKIKLFGSDKDGQPRTNINAVFSLVVAGFILTQEEIIEKINSFLPRVSLILLVFVMLLLLIGTFIGERQHQWTGRIFGIAVIVCLIAVFWAFTSTDQNFLEGGDIRDWWDDNWIGFCTLAGVIIVMVLVIAGGRRESGQRPELSTYFTKQ